MVYENKALQAVTLNQVLTNNNDGGDLGIDNIGDLNTGTGNIEIGDTITSGNPTFKINGWDAGGTPTKRTATFSVDASGQFTIAGTTAARDMLIKTAKGLNFQNSGSILFQDADDSLAQRMVFDSATGAMTLNSNGAAALVIGNEGVGADPTLRANNAAQALDLVGILNVSSNIVASGDLRFKNDTAFGVIFNHAVSADRTVTFPDNTGEVLLGGADQTAQFASKSLKLRWTNDIGSGFDGGLELEAIGAFTGDLVHIHQHTGNPGAVDLLFVEATDADVFSMVAKGTNPLSIEDASGDRAKFVQPTLTADRNFTLPDAAGTFALVAGNPAVTRFVSLNPGAFAELNNWAHDDDALITNIQNTVDANAKTYAPINLPDDAIVTSLKATMQGVAGAGVPQLTLYRIDKAGGSSAMAVVTRTSSSYGEEEDSSITNATIDNALYSYMLGLERINTTVGTVGLRNVTITYTATTPF